MQEDYQLPMPNPRVYFAIPSAHPERCRATLLAWRERGYGTIVLADAGTTRHDDAFGADFVVRVQTYDGWPASVNALCRDALPKQCGVIVTGGDDVLPDPGHTAEQLERQFLGRFPDTFGVMQPRGDAFMAADQYCGSPFIGRGWFESMYNGSGALYPRYRHNYADNELQWLARGMGVLWDRPDLTHRHEHFSRTGATTPTHWGGVIRSDLRDCMLYYARAHDGFPGHTAKQGSAGEKYHFHAPSDLATMTRLAEQRLIHTSMSNPFSEAMTVTLHRCQSAGHDPVALYGYGLFTQSAAASLREPPVRVDCIIDDDPMRQGRTAWNIPVISREAALSRGIKGVVIAALSVQDRLWESSAIFRSAGITVYRVGEACTASAA